MNFCIETIYYNQGAKHFAAGEIEAAKYYFSQVNQVKPAWEIPIWFEQGGKYWPNYQLKSVDNFEMLKPSNASWPKISIITPSFNQGNFIEATILSVLHQGYKNVEYVVIDGGSTDSTLRVLKQYQDRISITIVDDDLGQSDAINKGFRLASGDLLGWLNSDDMLAPGALHSLALSYLSSDCDVIAGMCIAHRNRKIEMVRKTKVRQDSFKVENLLDITRWEAGEFFFQPEVFFTRDIWEYCGSCLDKSLDYAMDHDLWLKFSRLNAKVKIIDWPIALFRKHKQQKTASKEAAKSELLTVIQSFSLNATCDDEYKGLIVDKMSNEMSVLSLTEYISTVEVLFKAKKWSKMSKVSQEIIANYPNSDKGYRWLGVAQEKIGDIQKQLENYRIAIQIEEKQPEWMYLVTANLLIKEEEIGTAIEYLKKALYIYPNSSEGHVWLGFCYEKLGDYQEVVGNYQAAININPQQEYWVYSTTSKLLLRLDRWKEAVVCDLKLVEVFPEKLVEISHKIGDLYSEKGNFSQAVSTYEKLLEKQPSTNNEVIIGKLARAAHRTALIFYSKQAYKKAALYYEKAIQAWPDNFLYHFDLGDCFLSQNRYAEAVDEYRKSISTNPDHFDSYQCLARALFLEGNFKLAAEAFQKAFSLSKNEFQYFEMAASACESAGMLDAAVDFWKQSVKNKPNGSLAKMLGQMNQNSETDSQIDTSTMNELSQDIYIVDPIFRGSRFYYTRMLFDAISKCKKARKSVKILTRKDASSEFTAGYESIFDGADMLPVLSTREGSWYETCSERVIKEIFQYVSESDENSVFIFSGLDELGEEFRNIGKALKKSSKSLVGYNYNLSNSEDVARHYSWLCNAFIHSNVLLLRDDNHEVGTSIKLSDNLTVTYIPDPVPYPRNELDKMKSEYEIGFIDDFTHTSILAVGVQSKRKGTYDLIRAAREINNSAKIYLSGTLDEAHASLEGQIRKNTHIKWRNAYVSEEEILKTYRAADYILLPYDRSFHGSSGVFAYAVAFGKPIISTEHGTIGSRIKQYNIGFTYESGVYHDLATIINNLPHRESDEYRALCERVSKYSELVSYETTLESLSKVVIKANLSSSTTSNIKRDESISQKYYSCDFTDFNDESVITLLDTGVASRNMGDHIIVDSIKTHMRKIFPHAIYVNIPTHSYLDSEAIKHISNSKYSFVCGTNLLASHMDDYKQWKIGSFEFSCLRDVILLGVGWWQYQELPNSYTQLLLNTILSKKVSHSVRDGFTKQQLSSVKSIQSINTGCPTMWGLSSTHLSHIPNTKRSDVITTLTDYKSNHKKDSFLLRYLFEHFEQVYVWIQGTGDLRYLRELAQTLDTSRLRIIPGTLEHYDEFLELHTDVEYVGTRLHAGIRALQKKKKTLIIGVDNRAIEISKDTLLPVVDRNNIEQELAIKHSRPSHQDIRILADEIDRWIKQFCATPPELSS